MAKYRIIKHEYPGGTITFEVQKRLPILGIWYNFNNIDAYYAGEYSSEEKAREAIDDDRLPIKQTIINVIYINYMIIDY